jgi:hypothetical protein
MLYFILKIYILNSDKKSKNLYLYIIKIIKGEVVHIEDFYFRLFY